MRTPSLSQLLLFALLAFQLAFGLQQSAGVPHPDSATAHHDVMQHAGSASASMMTAGNDRTCAHHSTPTPDNKHDCCKSSACQCQCGYVSLAATLDGPKGIPASTQVQPTAAVRFATTPADTLFRPPIGA